MGHTGDVRYFWVYTLEEHSTKNEIRKSPQTSGFQNDPYLDLSNTAPNPQRQVSGVEQLNSSTKKNLTRNRQITDSQAVR